VQHTSALTVSIKSFNSETLNSITLKFLQSFSLHKIKYSLRPSDVRTCEQVTETRKIPFFFDVEIRLAKDRSSNTRNHRVIIRRKCLLTASSSLIYTDASQKSVAAISPFTVAYDRSCRGPLGLSGTRLTRPNNETSRKTILVGEGGERKETRRRG